MNRACRRDTVIGAVGAMLFCLGVGLVVRSCEMQHYRAIGCYVSAEFEAYVQRHLAALARRDTR